MPMPTATHDHDHHDHDHHSHEGGEHDDHEHGSGLWARLKHHLIPHSHDAAETIQTSEEASSAGIRTAWISLAAMMATAILQMVIVAISGSIALLADTLHNLGHAVTTIPLVIAFHLGRRAASRKYPYGFRRAEDLAGVLISLVIAASIVLIVFESIDALVNPRPLANLGWVFAAGLVGAAGNEIVAWYRIRTGRKIGSAALIAEGHHARADGLTSLAVVAGVIGTWLGFQRADAIVGLLIAVVILGILISSVRSIGRRLMDGIEPQLVDDMHNVAASVPGVRGVDRIRARWVGHRIEADAELRVDADLTVREGHQLADTVEHELLHRTPHLEAVVVHLHPAGTDEEIHELTRHHHDPEVRAARAQQKAEVKTDS